MQLRQIITHRVEVIHPNVTLDTAAQKMCVSNIGSLPVWTGDQLEGMLNDNARAY